MRGRATSFISLFFAGTALTFVSLSAAQTQPSVTTQSASERAQTIKLIDQLDDADPDIRVSATLRINGLGAGALDVAEAAAKREDLPPETRKRLEKALTFIRPRAIVEQRRASRDTWRSNLFHNAYRNSGHTNPKYDAFAHAAIDQYLAIRIDPLNAPADLHDQAIAAFERAEQAGCDEPMIRALHRLADGHMQGASSRPRRGDDALFYGCCTANYPVALKFHLWASYVAAFRFVVSEDVQLLADLMAQALATPGFPPEEIDERLDGLDRAGPGFLGKPDWKSFFRLYETLAPDAVGPLLFRARETFNSAITFRGVKVRGNQFDDAALTEFERIVHSAVQIADTAYQRDPADGRAARFVLRTLMVIVQYTQRKDPALDVWFDRAVAADPDDLRPYELKLDYLQYTDAGIEEIMEFGHQCRQSQNWRGGVAMIIVSAHERVADRSGDRGAYFLQPQVWADIQSAFEGGLINFPEDIKRRCEYAKVAGQCGHWDVADREFQKIGDHPVISVFGSDATFKYLRNKAHRLATAGTTDQ
jgi:hypothetical protein